MLSKQVHTTSTIMDSPTAPHCETCGETLTPDGRCFNLGACDTADEQASRGSSESGFAFGASAWTFGGRVD